MPNKQSPRLSDSILERVERDERQSDDIRELKASLALALARIERLEARLTTPPMYPAETPHSIKASFSAADYLDVKAICRSRARRGERARTKRL